MKTLYEILEIERNASGIIIKEAYKKLVMEHHPDKGGDTEIFILIQQAYEILMDPDKRREYDLTGYIPNQNNEEGMILSKAKNNLITAIRGIINSPQFANYPDTFDILKGLKNLIRENKGSISAILPQKEKQIKIYEKALKKLGTKLPESFLHRSIEEAIDGVRNEINTINLDLKVIDMMNHLLEDYSYEANPVQQTDTMSAFLNMINTTQTGSTVVYRF